MCDNLRGRLIRCARGEELRGGDVGVGFSLWGSSRLYASLSFLSSPAARILRSAHARRGFSSEKKKRFSLAESLELRCHGICPFASTTISSVFDFLVSDTVRLAITPFSTPSDPKNPPFFLEADFLSSFQKFYREKPPKLELVFSLESNFNRDRLKMDQSLKYKVLCLGTKDEMRFIGEW